MESKSTLVKNMPTGQVNDNIQVSALKTIAGVLNAKGGTLLIGIADDGEVLGFDADGFQNEDKLGLHLVNLVKDRTGEVFLPYIHPPLSGREWRKGSGDPLREGAKSCLPQRRELAAILCARRERDNRIVRRIGHGLRKAAVRLASNHSAMAHS